MRGIASLLGLLSLIHGISLGSALIFLSNKRKTSLFLGLFLVTFGLSFLSKAINDYFLGEVNHKLFFLPFRFYFLSFPLLFLFVKGVFQAFDWKKELVHLLPGIIEFLIFSILFLFISSEDLRRLFHSDYFATYIVLSNIYSLVYILKTRSLIQNDQLDNTRYLKVDMEKLFKWLKPIVYIFLVILIDDILFLLLLRWTTLSTEYLIVFQSLYVTQSLVCMGLTYWIAFFGMKQHYLPLAKTTPKAKEINKEEQIEMDTIYAQVMAFIEKEKSFTNEELTIVDLANDLDIHYRKLSKIINHKAGCNFNHFINRFRVDEAKKIMSDPARVAGLTLEVLGQEVGFKSQSSLYTAFKKFEGITPAKFMKNFKNI